MENSSKKPKLVKQEAADQGSSRAVVVADPAPPVVKMAIEIDKSMYDCLICSLPLKPPVLQCRARHGACSSCADTHSRRCWCGVDGEYEHIPCLDPYIMEAKVRCPNEPFGCSSSVTYCLVEDHRLECLHAPCYCPEPGCAFAGLPSVLCDHLTVTHHDWPVTHIALGQTHELEIGEAERRRLLATENGEHLFLLVVSDAFGGGREVRVVHVRGNHAGAWRYWFSLWTNAPVVLAENGGENPEGGFLGLMLAETAASCAVPSETAALEVCRRALPVHPVDMHPGPGGGFALGVRIIRDLARAD